VLILLVKITVVLAAALVASRWASRASAVGCHALWTATFSLLLVLPVLSFVLPTLHISIPQLPASPHETLAGQSPSFATAPQSAPEPGLIDSTPRATMTSQGTEWRRLDLRSALLGLWAIGALVGLGSLGSSVVRAQLLARGASPIDEGDWQQAAETLAYRLGWSGRFHLLISGRVSVPMAGGILRARVYLPPAARTWPSDTRDVVLAHEIAHLAARDPLRQIVVKLAMALYWFHPLAWWAARQQAVAQEDACDEVVLSCGTRPSVYARVLLDLAHLLGRANEVAIALPIVSRSRLEDRLIKVLGQPRRRPRTAVIRWGTTVAALAAMPVAAAQIEPRARSLDFRPTLPTLERPSTARQVIEPMAAPALPAVDTPRSASAQATPTPSMPPSASIEGRVVTATGEGVREVHVRLLSTRALGGHEYLIPIHAGERMATFDGSYETTSSGTFVFPSVQPGTYFLVALPEPFSRDAWRYMFPPAEGPTGYEPAYFPSGNRSTDARPIEVRENGRIDNLIITLNTVQTGSVAIEAVPAGPGALVDNYSDLYFAPSGQIQPAMRMQRRGTSGTLLFEHVPVGEYVVSNDPLRRVTVRAGETTTVTIFSSQPTIRTKVSIEGSGLAPSPADLTLRFERADEFTELLFGGIPNPTVVRPTAQGDFRVFELRVPTILRVDPPAGWTLKRVMLNGREITNLALDFSRVSEGLEIVLARVQ
jgi:beta-lactamase regulating signal transducer with metallopeptidase domain